MWTVKAHAGVVSPYGFISTIIGISPSFTAVEDKSTTDVFTDQLGSAFLHFRQEIAEPEQSGLCRTG